MSQNGYGLVHMIRMVRIVFRLHRVREVVEAFLTTPSMVLSLFLMGYMFRFFVCMVGELSLYFLGVIL